MRIDQLQCFVQISGYHSLRQASKNMFVTPQTLSSSISKMEQELGFNLLERSQLGIELTNQGMRFLNMAAKILNEYDTCLKEIRGDCGNEKTEMEGSLKIYMNLAFEKALLLKVVSDFANLYPKCSIHSYISSWEDSYKAIHQAESEGIDAVAFIGAIYRNGNNMETEQQSENVSTYPVMAGKLAACVSWNSPLAGCKQLSLKTIASHPIVMFHMQGQKGYNNLFHGYGEIRILFSTGSISAWLQATKEYNCISLINDCLLEKNSSLREAERNGSIKRIEIAEPVACNTFLLAPKKKTPVVNEFLRYMKVI